MVIFELRGVDYPRKRTEYTFSTNFEKILQSALFGIFGDLGFSRGISRGSLGRPLSVKVLEFCIDHYSKKKVLKNIKGKKIPSN